MKIKLSHTIKVILLTILWVIISIIWIVISKMKLISETSIVHFVFIVILLILFYVSVKESEKGVK